jgi:ketosteroid isomerase-like protein
LLAFTGPSANIPEHARANIDNPDGWSRRMDIRSTLKELCEAFNAHDLDRIMAVFSDDCILEMPRGNEPWGSRFEGKRNVREALATRFEGLPDVHYGNDEHLRQR